MAKAKKSKSDKLIKAKFTDYQISVIPCKKIKVAKFRSGPIGMGVPYRPVMISGPPAQVDALIKLLRSATG